MSKEEPLHVINFIVKLNTTIPLLLEEIRNYINKREPTNFGESVVDIIINHDDNLRLWCAVIYFFGGE